MNTTPRKTFLALLGTSVASLALVSTPAFAQDAPAEEEAEDSASIIVTGSRIARPNLEAASPVTVVGAEQVQLTGTTTVESLLNELPQIIPGNTRVSNNSGGENFSTIDLRGLGPGRTLILLDGERLPASTTTGVTDVSQIPTGLIQRIDVVTGGASAVYGSDAIAGVVNFILKQDFQGMELTGQVSQAESGTGFGFNVSGLLGGNFADDRGNLTVYASYTDRDSVSQGRYGYSRISNALFFDPVNGGIVNADDPSDIPAGFSLLASGGSATAPQGTITALAGNAFRNLSTLLPNGFGAANTDCNTATPGVAVNAGTLSFNQSNQLGPNFSGTGFCPIPIGTSSRFNFAPSNYLITPYDRFTVTALGHYDLNDSTVFRLYTSFTNANQQINLAPTPATGIIVPANSPLIPADLRIALNSRINPAGDFTINRRFTETGPRDGRFKTDAKNIRGVLEHQLNDDWSVNGILAFGRVDNALRGIGNINRTAVTQGLRGCPVGASLPGCVPINIFGANTLTPAMLSFVRVDTQETESFEQVRGAVNLVGSFGSLPGGAIGVALGAEVRKDTAETVVDDAQRTGDIFGFNAVQSISGSIDVREVYGEIRLPVLDFVTLGAGGRYSDYSTVGGLFNYKGEIEVTPASFVKLRATYNKAARAPNVFELFRNGDQGFAPFNDPCNDSTARTAAVLARCQASRPGFDFTGFQQNNSQVQAFAFGSPNLSEEKAETYTVGAVFTPGRVLGGELTATVDYYNIRLTNRVAGLGATFFIAGCFSGTDPTACALIVRDTGTGQINSVNTSVTNSATPLETAGIDVGLDWATDLMGGRFSISDVFTYVDKFDIGDLKLAGTTFAGIGGVTVRYANTLTAAYRKGPVTFQGRYVWKQGGKQNFPGSDFDGFYAEGDPTRIPDLHLVNLSLRVQATDNLEITGIVNNLLDKFPPQTPTGFFEQSNTNINFYDPYALGRNYTVQARVRF